MARKAQVHVDFNEVYEDKLYGTPWSIYDSSLVLLVDSTVVAGDEDGNTVLAVITAIGQDLITLDPDMSTWEDGP